MKIHQKQTTGKIIKYADIQGEEIILSEIPNQTALSGTLAKGQTLPVSAFLTSILSTKAIISSQLDISELNLNLDKEGNLLSFKTKLEDIDDQLLKDEDILLPLHDVISIFGASIEPELVPAFQICLKELSFDKESEQFYIYGLIISNGHQAEIQLKTQILSDADINISFSCSSENNSCITIRSLIESSLPESFRSILPVSDKDSGNVLLNNLLNSGISKLQFNLNTAEEELNFFAKGILMGMTGEIGFSIMKFVDQRMVSFHIYGDEKQNLNSIPGLLKDTLGIELSQDIEQYLPKMEFALSELSFDQLDERFKLRGVMAQGGTSQGIQGYRLNSSLEVEWKEGIRVAIDLDATDAPLTLKALENDLPFSLDTIKKSIPEKILEKIGATAFHKFAIDLDTDEKSFAIEGMADLFGDLLVSASFSYSAQKGLKFKTTVYDDPYSLAEIIQFIGIEMDETLLPTLKIGLKELSFDQEEKQFQISGIVIADDGRAELSLDLQLVTGGVKISFNYHSEEDARLTVGNLIHSTLPESLHSMLPAKEEETDNVLLRNLLDSGLTDLQFNVNTVELEVDFFARGILMGMKGEIGFSIMRFIDNRLVSFHIYGDEKTNLRSIPDVLTDTLGIAIPEDVISYMPKMEFALLELTFDQLEKCFRLKGVMAQGGTSKGLDGYRLEGSFEIEWESGIAMEIELDARKAPVSLTALSNDLPFSIEGIKEIIPAEIVNKIGATEFHHFSTNINTAEKSFGIEGTAKLFGELLVTASLNYFQENSKHYLSLNASFFTDPLSLRDLPNLIGLENICPQEVTNMLPDLGTSLNQIVIDQKQIEFSIRGMVAIGESSAETRFEIKKHAVTNNLLINLGFVGNATKPPSFITLIKAIIPDAANINIPDKIDIQLLLMDLSLDITNKNLTGDTKAAFVIAGERINLEAKSSGKDDPWTLTVLSQPANDILLMRVAEDLLGIPHIDLPLDLDSIAISDIDVSITPETGNFRFGGKSKLPLELNIGGAPFNMELGILVTRESTETGITGIINGTLKHNQIEFKIDSQISREAQSLNASLENLKLSVILDELLGVELPEEIPDIAIEKLMLELKNDKSVHINGKINFEKNKKITSGKALSSDTTKSELTINDFKMPLGSLEFDLNRHATAVENEFTTTAFIKVSTNFEEGKELSLGDDLRCNSFEFYFNFEDINGQKSWKLGGDTDVTVFKKNVKLSASYEDDKTTGLKVFQMATNISQDLGAIPKDTFANIKGIGKTKSPKVWQNLITAGYIYGDKAKEKYKLTKKFRPFEDDFVLVVNTEYRKFSDDIICCLIKSTPLITIPNVLELGESDNIADIDIKALTLLIKKQDSVQGVSWSFSAIAGLNIYDPIKKDQALLSLKYGKLTIFDDKVKNEAGFLFEDKKAELNINIFNYSEKGEPKTLAITTGLKVFKIMKKEDTWDMSCTASVEFKDVPSPLNKVFAEKIDGSCVVNSNGISLIISRLAKPVELDLSYLQEIGLTFDLGYGIVDIRDIAVNIGNEVSISGDLAIGLPSRLNNVLFGEFEENGKMYTNVDFFKTYYKPVSKDATELTKEKNSLLLLNLHIGTDGIMGTLNSSPFQAIKLQDYRGTGSAEIKKWIFIDLCKSEYLDKKTHQIKKEYKGKAEDYGLIKIQMPEFAFDIQTGSFRASGGYEIDQDRGIKIPLTPLIKLFELMKLDDLSKIIPTAIPVKTIDLVKEDKNGRKTLDTHGLDEIFKSVDLGLPKEFLNLLDEVTEIIGDIIDNLPNRFTDYLSINVPQSLSLNIDITADGGFSFGLNTSGDPLQLLIPCGPLGQLMGVRLSKLAVGTAFGGSCLKVEIDGDIDNFDLITLGTSLLLNNLDDKLKLPQEVKDLLPDCKRFQNSFVMRDFFVLIIIATEIPIPIPIFYKRLEMAYVGVDGFEINTLLSFPKPEIGIGEILKIITNAKSFIMTQLPEGVEKTPANIRKWVDEKTLLNDGNYGLELSKRMPSTLCDTALSAGPFYIMLPRYLGPSKQDVYVLDSSKIQILRNLVSKFIKDNNEKYETFDDNLIIEKLSKIKLLKDHQFLTEDHYNKSVRQAIEADLQTFAIDIKEEKIKEKISDTIFNNALSVIDDKEYRDTLQKSYTLSNGKYLLNQDAKKDEIKKVVKYYQLGESLQASPITSMIKRKELDPVAKKSLGQYIGLKGNITLPSFKEIINTSLNSVKLLSLNYLIESIHIDDRISSVELDLFYIFNINVVWVLSTPKEFEEKGVAALKRKYLQLASGPATKKKYPVIKKESPADELLKLLADNDTGQEVTAGTEGICIFLKGALDIANGAVILETAFGLTASGVTGFKTGVSFKGFIMNVLDVKLLGFIKVSPKSKTGPFTLLGKSSLSLFNREVMMGIFELTTGEDGHLYVVGKLDLFPEAWPIKLQGYIMGYISKNIFQFDATSCLELGNLKASAELHILAKNSKLAIDVNVQFANSYFIIKFLSEVRQSKAAMFLDVAINAFNIIKFNSRLTAVIDMARGAALNGHSTLDINIPLSLSKKPKVLRVVKLDTTIKAVFDVKRGYLGVEAALTNKSFILSPACKISGGFAFYSWFKADAARRIPAGDFVFSIGGYHPKFNRPAHYPAVTRTGINWRITNNVLIKGSTYFALTPSCIMTGGSLQLVWQRGGLKAWFTAQSDFLIAWKPFFYDARLRVSMGVSYTFSIKIFRKRISKTFSYQIGADLHLWGPELSGRARIKLVIISFTVSFGNSKAAKPRAITDWSIFRDSFLQDTKQNSLLKINVSDGLVKEIEEGKSCVINPQKFSLRTSNVIPVKELSYGKKKAKKYASDFGVAPMNIKRGQFNTKQTISIKRDGSENVEDKFDIHPIVENSPKAIWGESMTPNLNEKQVLISNTVTGFDIKPNKPEKYRGRSSMLSINKLRKGPSRIEDIFEWETVEDTALAKLNSSPKEISSTVKNTKKVRLDIINEFFGSTQVR